MEAIDILESTITDFDNMFESDDGDGKIESKEELKSYAMEIAKEIFDDVDEKKIDSIVDNAIKKSDGDWEKASGIVKSSLS
jgi:6-phosphogluconate dehydrogenase